MTNCDICSVATVDLVTTACCSTAACRLCAVTSVLKSAACWRCGGALKISDLSPAPAALQCPLCSYFFKRAVRSDVCRSECRACRGCAVKFITQNRRCWSCGNTSVLTTNLSNDLDTRKMVENYLKTGELPPNINIKVEESMDVDEPCTETESVTSSKRDSDGKLKSVNDQTCSTVSNISLLSNISNTVLVSLSLQDHCHNIKTSFSKQFLRLLRDQGFILKEKCVSQKCEVIERGEQFFALIHINFKHSQRTNLDLPADYHVANYQKISLTKDMIVKTSREVSVHVQEKTIISDQPAPCPVMFSFQVNNNQETLTSHIYHITSCLDTSVHLVSSFLQPLRVSQDIRTSVVEVSSELMIVSATGSNLTLYPGQLLGKASNNLNNIDVGNLFKTQACDNDDVIKETDLDKLSDSQRLKLAEEKKAEGNSLYREKEFSSAIEKYSSAIKLVETSHVYYNNRSACYLELEQPRQSLEDALKAVEIDSNYIKAWNRIVKCYIMLGDMNKARAACDRILSLSLGLKDLIESDLGRIKMVEQFRDEYQKASVAGDHAKALFTLDLISQICSHCDKTHVQRCLFYALKQCFDESNKIMREQLHHCQDSVEVRYVKAVILYYQDDFTAASDVLNDILRDVADHAPAVKCLELIAGIRDNKDAGNKLFREEKYEEACQQYSQALSVDKSHARVNAKLYCNRAACHLKLSRFSEAVEDCSKAISLDTGYKKAYHRRVLAFTENEEFEQAVKDCETLVKLDVTSKEYLDLLKDCRTKLRDSKNKDFYKIIGVERSASVEDIKRAYKKAALVHHPDRHAVADDNIKNFHLRRFKELGEAYAVLSDAGKRAEYDRGSRQPFIHAANSEAVAKAYAAAAAQAQAAAAARNLFASTLGAGGGAGGRVHLGAGLAGARPGFVYMPGVPQSFVNMNMFNVPRYNNNRRRF